MISKDIKLHEVGKADKPVLANLMQFYLYDSSEFNEDEIDLSGKYNVGQYFDAYWLESERYPFFIRYDNKLVGFALVRQIEVGRYSIAEFFVTRKYRGKGIGKRAAMMLFDKFQAEWHVAQEEGNLVAQKFWRAVAQEYTGGNFTETLSTNQPKGPKQIFQSRVA